MCVPCKFIRYRYETYYTFGQDIITKESRFWKNNKNISEFEFPELIVWEWIEFSNNLSRSTCSHSFCFKCLLAELFLLNFEKMKRG